MQSYQIYLDFYSGCSHSKTKELSQEFRFLKHKYRLVEMSKSDWKFFRLRPSAFPTVRLAQLAQLMHHNTNLFACIMDQEKLKGITQLLQLQLSDYWNTHYQFDHKSVRRKKSFGKGLINNIIINTIIPFLFVCSKDKGRPELQSRALRFLKEIKAENNHIVRRFQTHGVSVENAGKTQALLHLKKVYCDAKKCLNCSIASQWLKT